MNDPVPFLTAFGHAIAALGLYQEGHPARQRAVVAAYHELRDLLSEDPAPQFTFIEDEVLYGRRVLRELPRWDWVARLPRIGIERIEFPAEVIPVEFRDFLREIHERLHTGERESAPRGPAAPGRIRFGPVAVTEHSIALGELAIAPPLTLQEEAGAILWIHDQVQHIGTLPLQEADLVVRALAFAMHREQQIMLPLLQLKEFDEYTTTHANNVAVLSMALAEYLGLAARDIRMIGVAGLLHDLGKVRVPREILVKRGTLTPEERAIMEAHPVDGARIILDSPHDLDLAAVVAYEHHLWLAPGGYPSLRFPRHAHYVSRLVHVCDVYDALSTDRPYRPALDSESALAILAAEAGTSFDPELTEAFTGMLQEAELCRVRAEDVLPSAAA